MLNLETNILFGQLLFHLPNKILKNEKITFNFNFGLNVKQEIIINFGGISAFAYYKSLPTMPYA